MTQLGSIQKSTSTLETSQFCRKCNMIFAPISLTPREAGGGRVGREVGYHTEPEDKTDAEVKRNSAFVDLM